MNLGLIWAVGSISVATVALVFYLLGRKRDDKIRRPAPIPVRVESDIRQVAHAKRSQFG